LFVGGLRSTLSGPANAFLFLRSLPRFLSHSPSRQADHDKMPRYFDASQLQKAITAQAMPALGVLAADPSRLDRSRNRRFERDDPPPYMSSSESESEEALHHPVLARPQEGVLEDFAELLSQPLSKEESDELVTSLNSSRLYSPGRRYRSETRL
jgi:hypothetical protein